MNNYLKDFFSHLNDSKISYCVLRGYEGLPERHGRDIDILIGKIKNPIGLISNIISGIGLQVYVKSNFDGFFTVVAYSVSENEIFSVQLDFWTSLNYRGIPWCETDNILNNRMLFNNIYIASLPCEAYVLTLKELFGGGKIKSKYYERIVGGLNKGEQQFKNCFPNYLKKESDIIVNFIKEKEFLSIDKMGTRIKKRIRFSKYSVYIKETITRMYKRIGDFLNPRGIVVTFIGPDGSGKSTFIELANSFFTPFFEDTCKYHIRYGIFPELKTGRGISSMKGAISGGYKHEKNVKITKRTFISKLASWFVVLYYTFEFMIGNSILNKNKRKNYITIYDRYYYDHFFQPTSRDLIFPFRKFLCAFVKKPDVIIHLNASGENVFKRKQELNINEINSQNYYITKFTCNLKNAYTVNTDNRDIPSINTEIINIILSKVEKNSL